MTRFSTILLLLAALVLTSAAHGQSNVRVRGTITAVEGDVLAVKTRDGKDLKLHMTEKTVVAAAKAIALTDLKKGDYVGSAAMTGPDGTLVAREVHTIPRTVREGHGPWDLEPGSTMTNANVATVVNVGKGHELTLEHKGGSQKIIVPPGTPIVTTVPADRSFLKPGEYIFTSASVDAEGKMTVSRIQVSKDGVRPPQ